MKSIVARLIVVLAFLTSASAVADSPPRVVVTIKPFHSLASAVMEGVGNPYLVVRGFQSPHTYQLLPSDAQAFIDADLVYWVGPGLETNLGNFVSNLIENTTVVEITEIDGLTLISYAEDSHDESGAHEEHDEHEDDEHAHDGEAHDDDHGHEGEEHHDDGEEHASRETEEDQHEDDGHDDHDDHGHGHDHGSGVDVHVWLDVDNAKVVAAEMASRLSSVDPDNQETYLSNAKRLTERLDGLEKELALMAETVQNKPYIVFHDAYKYIEARYGLQYVEAITISPEQQPSAKRFRQLVNYAQEEDIHCVFKEPQFSSKTVEVLATEKDVSVVDLDPLGAELEPGPEAYFQLMRNIMASLQGCLLESAS